MSNQQPWLSDYPLQPINVRKPPLNVKAIVSMSLGICFVLTLCSFLSLFPLGFVIGLGTGIPAVILGHKAIKEITSSNGTQGGHKMASAGLVLGYLSIGAAFAASTLLLLAPFLFLPLLILIFLLFGTFFQIVDPQP